MFCSTPSLFNAIVAVIRDHTHIWLWCLHKLWYWASSQITHAPSLSHSLSVYLVVEPTRSPHSHCSPGFRLLARVLMEILLQCLAKITYHSCSTYKVLAVGSGDCPLSCSIWEIGERNRQLQDCAQHMWVACGIKLTDSNLEGYYHWAPPKGSVSNMLLEPNYTLLFFCLWCIDCFQKTVEGNEWEYMQGDNYTHKV